MLLRTAIQIASPSRLHFGLFSVGEKSHRQFGGVGLMIQSPQTRLHIRSASQWVDSTVETETIRGHVFQWFDHYSCLVPEFQSALELPCEISLVENPPRHAGFGTGTQLALSVAVALFRFFDLPIPQAEELASLMGRGGRSGIGTHGFFQGGLLVDRGRTANQSVASLDFQIEFPQEWPIILAMLKNHQGLSGDDEIAAFDDLPDAGTEQTNSMIDLVNRSLVPAVTMKDYSLFSSSVYELSFQSGLFFQSIQGGPYNGREIERLVASVRAFGIPAVGQSSWGPCVFAIAPNNATAKSLCRHLAHLYGSTCDVQIVRASNVGARTTPI